MTNKQQIVRDTLVKLKKAGMLNEKAIKKYLKESVQSSGYPQEVSIWINEFEDLKDNPEVVFTVYVVSEPAQKGGLETEPLEAQVVPEDCTWDKSLYTEQENAVIGSYCERASSEAVELYRNNSNY